MSIPNNKLCVDLTKLPYGRWEQHQVFHKMPNGDIFVQENAIVNLCNEYGPQLDAMKAQRDALIGVSVFLWIILVVTLTRRFS